MLDLTYCLTSLLFFWYSILFIYYNNNLNSSIICYIFSGDTYLSFGISVSSKLFCDELFKLFVILSATLLSFKSPVASAVFWTALFEAVFIAHVF